MVDYNKCSFVNKILLTNIQRFSLHDGPGIRTTVFLKGCSLHCPWCSNPENLTSSLQPYIKDGVPGTYGKYYSPDDLTFECLKDKPFYEGKLNNPEFWSISDASLIEKLPGGVTFSGGEALLQMPELVKVCEALHENHVHLALETCLFCPPDNLSLALKHIDLFYVDMKILDTNRCKAVEHGNLDLYLSNLETLLSWRDAKDTPKPVVIRIPVIGSYTDDEHNRREVHDLIKKGLDMGGKILKIELIKEHNLGESKYKSLGIKLDYHGVVDELMNMYNVELSDLRILTEVCKI